MNLLSIDYGKKRIGLAWCDTAVGVVLPYGIIEVEKKGNLGNNEIAKLTNLVKDERIQKVVMGLPLGLDGEENENTKHVREFGETLMTLSGVPVEYIDERFSTRGAHALGLGGATKDEKAAMVILETYVGRS